MKTDGLKFQSKKHNGEVKRFIAVKGCALGFLNELHPKKNHDDNNNELTELMEHPLPI